MLVMFVTLYTSRLILEALGVEDFGIYNVVGGIVSVLGVLQSVMASAVSRFFMFELGKKNLLRLNQYFRLSIIVYIGIAIIVLILAETIGLWFLKNKLIIPEERFNAAFWVFQFSILSFILKMISVPYTSIIIAHERMNVYAYIGIAEVLLKLLIVFLLFRLTFDKLAMYAILNFAVVLSISSIYYIYNRFKYPESRFSWFWNKPMFKEMIGFSIWSLYGSVAGVARSHGINILLGMFFNPVVNAARAVAYQVNGAINQFSNNFFTAVRPQITKKYAGDDNEGMMSLVFRSSRLSFYLVFLFALPILLETPYILTLWLKTPPEQSVLFTRLVVFTSIIDSMSHPFMTAINATGNIKYYQIVTGGLLILTLPIAYVFLKLGYPPESTMYVSMGISLLAQISRITFMKKQQNMSISDYSKQVLMIAALVLLLAAVAPFILNRTMDYGLKRFLIVLISSIISCTISIYFIGITKVERTVINLYIHNKINKLSHGRQSS